MRRKSHFISWNQFVFDFTKFLQNHTNFSQFFLGLSSLTLSDKDKEQSSSGQAENLAQDMHDLMHDFDVVSRISGLIGSLKGEYEVIDFNCFKVQKFDLVWLQFFSWNVICLQWFWRQIFIYFFSILGIDYLCDFPNFVRHSKIY